MLPFAISAADAGGNAVDLPMACEPLATAGRSRWRLRVGPLAARFQGTIRVRAEFPAGDCPWFLIPGFFYGQGRSESSLRYPALRRPGGPDDEMVQPWWAFSLDRASHPLVAARSAGRWRALDAEPHYRLHGAPERPATWGDDEPQIGLGLGWDQGQAHVEINLPAWEGPLRHVRNRRSGPKAKVLDLPAGATLELDLGWWDVEGGADGYHPMVQRIYAELQDTHPRAEHETPLELAECAAHGLKAWHWVPAGDGKPGYWVYTAAMDRSVEFNANVNRGTSLGWHFESLGFVGGFPVAHGLHWWARRHGDSEAFDIVEQCAGRWCREGLSPSGLFRTSYHPGKARTRHGNYANGSDEPSYGACWQPDKDWAHARTTADASYYLARLLAQGLDRPEWRRSLCTSLEAALRLQRADGRHAQMYDATHGTVVKWEGDAGMLWIPAMDAAHDLFADDPAFQDRLRRSMLAAGEAYAGAVEAERICGAPEDVSLAPTSEDGYNAVMTYARLHRRFGGDRWLALWRRAVLWTCTWRKAYNVRFDRRNIFGAGGLRTVGGDYASSNNNHLHVYGLNCLAEFHRLAALTGERWIADRADDNLAFCSQLLCTVDGRWNGQRGMATEQFYFLDWSIWDGWDQGPDHVQKGTFMGTSHVWCVNHILLGMEELEQVGRFR